MPSEVREVIEPQAPLRQAPSPDAPLDTEALKGERVKVLEVSDEGWTRGRLESDGYEGWLPSNSLGAPGLAHTHKVAVLRTLAFPGPDIKLPPVEALPFGSRLAVTRPEGAFAVTAAGHYVPLRHLAMLDTRESDPVAVAERFVGTPYLWGGKTTLGLDCSGLTQVSLTACGIPCPRDSRQQQEAVGQPIGTDFGRLQRGDLIFWRGHVALVRDTHTIIHANAFHMAVAIEPVSSAVARIRKDGSEIRVIRRL